MAAPTELIPSVTGFHEPSFRRLLQRRKDPDWVAAKDASEKKAGGSLTVLDGVKSVFLKPTDYSPLK